MTTRELVKLLEKNGWTKVGQVGSHAKFVKPGAARPVMVPMHKGDLKTGLLMAILKQAGLR